jgi:PAS domain S-box-containing protein
VATENGLDRFRQTAVTTMSVRQGLSQGTPWSVLAARDGSVWIGTLDGLNRIENDRITIYRTRPTTARSVATALEPRHVRQVVDAGLPDNLIQSLFEDERGRLWVSTREGVAWFENERFTPVPDVSGGVHAITGHSAGNIWISEATALIQLAGGRIGARVPWSDLQRRVPAVPIVADGRRGGVWLAFRDGSGVAHFRDGRLVTSYSASDGLGRGMVGDLRLDPDGALWAATEEGLSRIKDGRIHTLSSKAGLPCDGVHWTVTDNDGALWLYTACGLARIARDDIEQWIAAVDGTGTSQQVPFTIFDSSDGIRIHSAPGGYTPQVAKSSDGRIWFLPWDGVSVLDPRHLPVNRLRPPVHIEQITADGRRYLATSGLRLPALSRNVAIEYSALSLVAPERVRFRYKLEGQDPEWREVVNDRRVQYSNLGPGRYRFRVAASNNSGIWNEAGAALAFAIAPAYYQTTWFRVLSLGAVLCAVIGAYRLRIRTVQREERKHREIVDRIPGIAGIARPDGSDEYLNERWVEFTGLPRVGPAGSGWELAVHPDDVERYTAAWHSSLIHGEAFENEARFRSKTGQYRWFLVRAVPVRDRSGRIRKWYRLMADIEDRKVAERQLEQLSGRLIHAQEEERRRIGRELHDDISQMLGLLAIKIDELRADPTTPAPIGRALAALRVDAGEVAADVHRLSHELHSSTLDYLGLVPALKTLVGEFSKRHGISVGFEGEPPASPLPSDMALCLFRIVQECLNNIAKHSRARSAGVRMAARPDGIELTVEDDGVGFDPSAHEHRGLGFVSMRERLRLVHGSVRVDSATGRGTRIQVHIPTRAVSPAGEPRHVKASITEAS